MIPDMQALEMIEEWFHIPGVDKANRRSCVFAAFRKIAAHAEMLMENSDYGTLQRLMQLLLELDIHCSATVRNAIENITIYRLSHAIDRHADKEKLFSLFPEKLAGVVNRYRYSAAI